jgi:DNA-binding FadR family transcriptional regulator
MVARKTRGVPDAPCVAERLSQFISSDHYPLHSRLPPERQLCAMLQVSRSVLRDGLDELEQAGRIWRHVGKGTFVGGRPQSVQSRAEALGAGTTLSELLEARMVIEPQVARLAALRAEPSDLDLMQRYDACAVKAEDWATWDRWDELLHRAIAEASGNGPMISAVDQIIRIKKHTPWTITRAKTFVPALKERYSSEHRAVLDAIANHDPQAAEQAMDRHIKGISSSIGPAVLESARTDRASG